MSLLDDPDSHDLEGLAITASGVDRSSPTRVPVDRYISPEWMAIENEKVWPRAWQPACSVDHVAEPAIGHEQGRHAAALEQRVGGDGRAELHATGRQGRAVGQPLGL